MYPRFYVFIFLPFAANVVSVSHVYQAQGKQ